MPYAPIKARVFPADTIGMNTHQLLTYSQAIWLYGSSDTTALNARFSNDARDLGYSMRLYAVALSDNYILCAYTQPKNTLQQKHSNINTLQLTADGVKNPDSVTP